jgi:hypothetical protein
MTLFLLVTVKKKKKVYNNAGSSVFRDKIINLGLKGYGIISD